MTRFLRLILAVVAPLAITGCEQPPVNRDASSPLSTAAKVDLERYLGRWYEVARFPNSFERDCFAVTATYSRNADGTVKVVNSCRKGSIAGPEDVAEGSAAVV
ncbi:MAG: lipocalin family protein, partial [Alphaproteobacteria bacterium]|nr:lipocalin family protein [Alphaproteobacteria bacterium]